jgi:hypothetical protein
MWPEKAVSQNFLGMKAFLEQGTRVLWLFVPEFCVLNAFPCHGKTVQYMESRLETQAQR